MGLQGTNGGVLAFSGTGLEQAIEELKQICPISCPALPESKEIHQLVATMNHIIAVLKDAEKKQISSETDRLMLWELKQVVFDAEDLIDEFATDAAVQLMGAHTCNIPTMTPRMMGQVCEMNDRLDRLQPQISMLAHQLSITTQGSCPGLTTWRQTSSLLPDETSVIGRDREKEHVIEILLSSTWFDESSSNNKGFSVLPIVGLGGVGKTTLAQLVFNDQIVKKHFELMMWVCVSNNFDPIRLTKNIIEAALAFRGTHKKCKITNWDSMQRRLLEEVKGKTFLLVLDDVWKAEHSMWEELFKPLHSGKKGSKVLVTTRNRAFVDKLEGPMETPILLGGLSDADIWDLFKRYAFKGNTHVDGTTTAEYYHLEDIGRHIVQRLKGSPLVARTIGSLLNHEVTIQHWKTVLESEFWTLEQVKDGILPALQLSYQYLHPDLKQCFAYCSLFPKDHEFSRELVVQLWEAQSFIRRDRGTRMQETGSKYFDELLHMSFFEPKPYMLIKNAHVMHDLMHDLAECISSDDCFRLEDQKTVEIPDTVRHISVYVSKKGQIDIINKLCFYEKLRTLLFPRSYQLEYHHLDQLFQRLKMLRVLGLYGCGIRKLPDSIGDLKHLRHIDLEGNDDLENLPESLGNLYNLQVLNLNDCHSLRVLPATMSQLVNLKHLRADYKLVSRIDGVGKLTGLQELQVRGRQVRELGGMCMLRRLSVYRLEEVQSREDAIQARLHTLELLQVLKLHWSRNSDITSPANSDIELEEDSSDIELNQDSRKPELEEQVLQALRPNDGIRKLRIQGYGGIKLPDWMEVSTLTSFASLRRVSLLDCPNWQVPPCSFLRQLCHLESLKIDLMPKWEEWSCPVSYDCLLELRIKDCPRLKELPLLPLTLRSLDLFEVGVSCLPEMYGCSHIGGGTETSSSHSPPVSTSLSILHISDCDNLTSISGLLQQHLPDLAEIQISNCKNLVSLPEKGFGHLVSLKILKITECPKLTCLLQEEEDASTQHLPCSLKELEIEECGDEMGGWWWAGLHHLTSIAKLSLYGCPTTVELLFLSLERHHHLHLPVTLTELRIGGYNRFEYKQKSTTFSTCSSQLSPPTPRLIPLVDASARALRVFTSLKELTIQHSLHFLQKWGGRRLLSSLEQLTISGDDDFHHKCLPSIQSCPSIHMLEAMSLPTSIKTLTLRRCQNLRSLQHTLNCISSLETLDIWNCPSLQSLPDTLGRLSYLQTLVIRNCLSIQSLPTNGLPSSLQTLQICGCPTLTVGHRNKPKSMWPEVSHIPDVTIDWHRLQ
ncbi:hypothetical protein Taro_041973 [Colocasia esculenta]|uniref:Uncharacterized protein n=1 Tax=Colocasia esculenta TaxID=4460 RepID=A0A843WN80_COLES|nr:hypothetical protein [Colocasia esculenta]